MDSNVNVGLSDCGAKVMFCNETVKKSITGYSDEKWNLSSSIAENRFDYRKNVTFLDGKKFTSLNCDLL